MNRQLGPGAGPLFGGLLISVAGIVFVEARWFHRTLALSWLKAPGRAVVLFSQWFALGSWRPP